jgi:hypothetical protein
MLHMLLTGAFMSALFHLWRVHKLCLTHMVCGWRLVGSFHLAGESLVRGMTVLANWWSLPMEGRALTGASRRDSVSSDVHTFSTYKSYMHRVAWLDMANARLRVWVASDTRWSVVRCFLSVLSVSFCVGGARVSAEFEMWIWSTTLHLLWVLCPPALFMFHYCTQCPGPGKEIITYFTPVHGVDTCVYRFVLMWNLPAKVWMNVSSPMVLLPPFQM